MFLSMKSDRKILHPFLATESSTDTLALKFKHCICEKYG